MRSKSLVAVLLILLLIVGAAVLVLTRGSPLPPIKPAHAPGTYLSRTNAVFAGYDTPEAALESVFYAFFNGDYDAFMPAVLADQEKSVKSDFGDNPKRFKAKSRRESAPIRGLSIVARKNISSDKVELKFEIVANEGRDGTTTNFMIGPMVKVGKTWKCNFDATSDYKTNWDNGDVVTYTDSHL